MGKKRDALRHIRNDALAAIQQSDNEFGAKMNSDFWRGVRCQAGLNLEYLNEFLGEDYNYGE